MMTDATTIKAAPTMRRRRIVVTGLIILSTVIGGTR